MTRVDLITGFLGAGKTTFIHRYLEHLADRRVLVIENEFGSVGVDARLLRDEDCDIEDLSGVCMCCRGRGQFIGMLKDAATRGIDRVLVEPSGIYDVDEFFGVMDEVHGLCEIGSVVAIVDARVPETLSPESEALMFSQLMAAGAVVLSKVQGEDDGTAARTVAWLNGLIMKCGGRRVLGDEVWAVDWDALTEGDFERLMACGYRRDEHPHHGANHEELYDTFMTADRCEGEADLLARLDAVMREPRFGRVLRVKGYIRDLDGNWYEVNCTPEDRAVRPVDDVRKGVLVVIGQGLSEAALKSAFLPKTRT